MWITRYFSFVKRPSGEQCCNSGLMWAHRDSPCPAEGQTCRKSKKLNHYARVCRSPSVQITTNQSRLKARQYCETAACPKHWV